MRTSIYEALNRAFTSPVRDSLWGHVYLTPELEAVVRSTPFMRLHRIFQLGPVYCVYPGATHTRAAHSIGVFHLARRLILALAEQGADEWLTPAGVRSFLAATLLHDAGHFPYAHSLKELPLEDHEALTGKIILSSPMKDLVAQSGADPYFAAAIVDTGLHPGPGADSDRELVFYRKLLSGCLDPDKLDYLNRDARYAGVPYGAQDVDFIFSRLSPNRERGVDIDSRGIQGVESILFSKYLMYKAVYWHRSVRSATSMIKKALIAALEKRVIAKEELYDLDDQGLFTLMSARSQMLPILSLGDKVKNGCLYETAAEIPFDECKRAGSAGYVNIAKRSAYEERLAEALGKASGVSIAADAIIIDVPEPISFETGLYVTDERRSFSKSSALVNEETIRSFKEKLQIQRIFIDQSSKKRIKHNGKFLDILHTFNL
ncbi:MAG: HD domain-containing protein [Treponema sp.]|jgi:HD superfamily phosphohydrolase|nr:HD domain-containing protein [Treponema sp.]